MQAYAVLIDSFDEMVEANFPASSLRGKAEYGTVIAKAILAGAYAHLLCSTIDVDGKAEISWNKGKSEQIREHNLRAHFQYFVLCRLRELLKNRSTLFVSRAQMMSSPKKC
jgi:hypothetical protein